MIKEKKSINLLPTSTFEKTLVGKSFSWALTVGRYIIVAIELIVLIAFFSRFKLDRDLTNLNDSIEQKKTTVESLKEIEEEFRYFQGKTEAIKRLEQEQLKSEGKLSDISKITPSDISFDRLVIEPNSLAVEGIALSDSSLATFLAGLQENEIFEQISLDKISAGGTSNPNIEFTLRAEIKNLNASKEN